MNWLRGLFKNNKNDRIRQLLEDGAIVLDVRTQGEYEQDHMPGSLHIALDGLEYELDHLEGMNRPLIVCCAMGTRSAKACAMLQERGITCENGKNWKHVHLIIQSSKNT